MKHTVRHTKTLGECDYCTEPAIVKINESRGCATHVEDAVAHGMAGVHNVITALKGVQVEVRP